MVREEWKEEKYNNKKNQKIMENIKNQEATKTWGEGDRHDQT